MPDAQIAITRHLALRYLCRDAVLDPVLDSVIDSALDSVIDSALDPVLDSPPTYLPSPGFVLSLRP